MRAFMLSTGEDAYYIRRGMNGLILSASLQHFEIINGKYDKYQCYLLEHRHKNKEKFIKQLKMSLNEQSLSIFCQIYS